MYIYICMHTSLVPNKQGVLKRGGDETLNKWGGEGVGVGNFDNIKRKGLFVNKIQFYH